MSWDIMLVKTKTNTEPMEKIDEKTVVPLILTDVTSKLKSFFPDITGETAEWLDYEGDTFAISFNLATDQNIMLHVHILDEPEAAVIGVIKELCDIFNCRAFDTTSVEFLET